MTGCSHACVNETITFYCTGGPGIEIAVLPDASIANGVTAIVINRNSVNDSQYEYMSYALLRVSAETQVVNVTCTVSPTILINSAAANLPVRVSG